MQATQRRIDSSVVERLVAEPFRFEFFQAVRVLVLELARSEGVHDESAVGERIRFRDSISLVFPPSEIERIAFEVSARDDESRTDLPQIPSRYSMTTSFIGLTGPSGVLPRHYTERLAERDLYHRDRAAQAFLNQFSNRIVALFYRAWTKYRLHLQYEQDRRERFLPLMLSLVGVAAPGMRESMARGNGPVFDEAMAYYAAAIRQRPQTGSTLARVVAEYFGVKVQLQQFVGCWFEIPAEQRTLIGTGFATLGKDSFCGARIWQRQTRMRLTIGPLARQRFFEFLPQGSAAEGLGKVVKLLMGVTFEYEIQLILTKEDAYPARLGDAQQPARLGWDTFLQTRPLAHDCADARYEILPGLAA